MRRAAWTAALAFLVSCRGVGDAATEVLPAVPEPRIFQPAEVCVAPPPPGPFQERVAGDDLSGCLSGYGQLRSLPLELDIADGVVRGFRFYEPCADKVVTVPEEITRCVRSRLEGWRYVVHGGICPGHPTHWIEFQELRALAQPQAQGGCGT